jgi:hypothetical protein
MVLADVIAVTIATFRDPFAAPPFVAVAEYITLQLPTCINQYRQHVTVTIVHIVQLKIQSGSRKRW